jgi:hypothetical protein
MESVLGLDPGAGQLGEGFVHRVLRQLATVELVRRHDLADDLAGQTVKTAPNFNLGRVDGEVEFVVGDELAELTVRFGATVRPQNAERLVEHVGDTGRVPGVLNRLEPFADCVGVLFGGHAGVLAPGGFPHAPVRFVAKHEIGERVVAVGGEGVVGDERTQLATGGFHPVRLVEKVAGLKVRDGMRAGPSERIAGFAQLFAFQEHTQRTFDLRVAPRQRVNLPCRPRDLGAAGQTTGDSHPGEVTNKVLPKQGEAG